MPRILRRVISPAFLLLLTAYLLLSAGMASAQTSGNSTVKLGVYVTNPNEVPAFEDLIGRQAEYYLYYQPITNDFPADWLRPVAQEGRVIILSLETIDWNNPDSINQPAFQLRNITAGYQDHHIRRYARQLRDFGYTVMVRPMSEMNGWWTAWSGQANGNTPADFVPAWRHIHDIFQQEGATNVVWVWAPNNNQTTADAIWSFDNYYPGDAYVDYIGLCGYNWGNMYPSWSHWQSFEQVFGYSYDVMAARTNKPFIIAETSSPEAGGSKANWITDAFNTLPTRFPRVQILTWFNVYKEADWRVNSSASSLQAFRAAMVRLGPADLVSNHFAPIGSLDSVYIDQTGQLVSSGWAIDPSETGPIDVHIYVNGQYPANVVRAGEYRQDIANVYPGFGGNHGFTLKTPVIADTNEVCAYGINTGPGGNTFLGCKTVTNSWQQFPETDPPAGRHYYWPWYDGRWGTSWVLMSNPERRGTMNFDLNIAGRSPTLEPFGGPSVPAGGSIAANYEGLVGGPLVATSLTGDKAIVSQRTLWPKGGSSLEEVMGVEAERLSSHYYWTWYDMRSPSYKDWVLIANPGNSSVDYEIKIAGESVDQGSIEAGASVTPSFPGRMGGPVEVTASDKVIASQRVLSSGDRDFTEVPGVPAEELSDHYYWTWYDQASPGATDWVLVANPGDTKVTYEIKIAGNQVYSGSLQPGQKATPTFPGNMGGPLEVTASGEVIASQRVTWGASFDELSGYPFGSLKSAYAWTWYDQKTPGSQNWVLVANPGDTKVTYEIRIAGNQVYSGSLQPGQKATPTFPGTMNGPVEVTASGPVMASQRVLWQGFFNEVVGV